MIRATLYYVLSVVLFFFGIFLSADLLDRHHEMASLLGFLFFGALAIVTFNEAVEATNP